MTHRMPAHRLLATAAALAAGAALTLAAPAAAQAGQRPAPASLQHPAVRHAVTAGRRAGPTPAARPGRAAAGLEDARRVCPATAPAGYATCFALQRTNVKPRKGLFAADTAPPGYGPADLQSAYDLPSGTGGSGQTVAVIDAYNDPSAAADLDTYRVQYGLPACTTASGCFRKVNQDGQQGHYPAANASWAEEESLDVDMVSAVCPNCHILLVEAKNSSFADLGAAVNEAVALGARYVSNSYGSSYSSTPGSGEGKIELTWDSEYYDHPGVAVTASAGDSGYGVHYPAASPDVTAVGGTTLTSDPGTTRGWDETAWSGTGSGCSKFEPKPPWQADTGCGMRTVADVSADADPNTGVAVYDSGIGGWDVFGGTSVASPLIAAVYALAGPPAPGSNPAAYPYADPSALNDVTSGSNGTCTRAYLCTAGPGYDGPTGLGTPNGTAAFTPGAYGQITGQVTNAATGQPLPGVRVTTSGGFAVTNATGDYTLGVAAGSHDLTAADYGYTTQTADVTVAQGATTTENLTLAPAPTATVSGTVTDNSGQGWPLNAKITIDTAPATPGVPPAATVYTSPYTGRYKVTLPQSARYILHIVPVSPGYETLTRAFTLATQNKRENAAVSVEPVNAAGAVCAAPGYQMSGTLEQFTGWTGTTPQDGWTVTDNAGSQETWQFGYNPNGVSEPPGSDGSFAIATSLFGDTDVDTSLISPVANLSGVSAPVISFDTYYLGASAADVDLSLDGGQTWTTVWQQTSATVQGPVDIPVPQAAGQSDVQVRFHFTYTAPGGEWWWSVDNVLIGTCAPAPGGLVAGDVTDANTGQPLTGATVTSATSPPVSATAAAAPQAGLYEMFIPQAGKQFFTATESGGYQDRAKTVTVTPGAVTRASFALPAGDLSVSPGSLSGTVLLGKSTTQNVTITNTGQAAASFTITPQDASGGTPGWLAASPAQGQLAPGASATVTVTLNAAQVSQPGSYAGQLVLSTDTPYTPTAAVTMTVTPPKTWGEVTGTVSGQACNGTISPLPGATVEITSWAQDYSLTASSAGGYTWWLNKNNNPLTVIASLNGWAPQEQQVKIAVGQAMTVNFTLQPSQGCNAARR